MQFEEKLELLQAYTALVLQSGSSNNDALPAPSVDDTLWALKSLLSPDVYTTVEGIVSGRWSVQLPPPEITELIADDDIAEQILSLFRSIDSMAVRSRVQDQIAAVRLQGIATDS